MVQLQRPSIDLFQSYMSFIDEMKILGEMIWPGQTPTPSQSPEQFVQHLIDVEYSLNSKIIPKTTYWATVDNNVIGRIHIYHKLSEELKIFGGHIGYEVRPSQRQKGVATQMLQLILQTTTAKNVGNLLLTCAPDNLPSNKTIRTNGGILFNTTFVEAHNRETNYYWIRLVAQP